MQDGEDLTSNVAFEAADDLGLCHPLPGATPHILPRPLIVAESHKDNAIESGIGLSIASAVESVAFGLA